MNNKAGGNNEGQASESKLRLTNLDMTSITELHPNLEGNSSCMLSIDLSFDISGISINISSIYGSKWPKSPRVVCRRYIGTLAIYIRYIDDFGRYFLIFPSFDFRLLISCREGPTLEMSTIYHDISNIASDEG